MFHFQPLYLLFSVFPSDILLLIDIVVGIMLHNMIKLCCFFKNLSVCFRFFQVLYLVSLGGKPKKGDNFFYYTEQDLPHIINPLETKLGTTCLGFTCYFDVHVI